MLLVSSITDSPNQTMNWVLPDGSSIAVTLVYKPLQYGWFIKEMDYGTFTIQGVRICTSPNILHQFKNQLPFGISCVVTDNEEPTQQGDFLSGRAKIYILTASEVATYTEFLSD